MRSANADTNQWELMPDSMEAASAMPARSAAIFIVLAINRAKTKTRSSHLGKRCLRFPAKPFPVTWPMRAHMIWTAAIIGHVRSAVHSSLVPSCAPATEYVAIPDGSSSAAPVMIPGPRDLSSDRIQRDGADVATKWVRCAFPSDQFAQDITAQCVRKPAMAWLPSVRQDR